MTTQELREWLDEEQGNACPNDRNCKGNKISALSALRAMLDRNEESKEPTDEERLELLDHFNANMEALYSDECWANSDFETKQEFGKNDRIRALIQSSSVKPSVTMDDALMMGMKVEDGAVSRDDFVGWLRDKGVEIKEVAP